MTLLKTSQTLPVECIYEGIYLHLLLKGEISWIYLSCVYSVLNKRPAVCTYWNYEWPTAILSTNYVYTDS